MKKRTILILSLVLIVCGAIGQSRDSTICVDSLKLCCKGTLIDTLKNGQWTCRDIVGHITSIEDFKNGERNGTAQYFLNGKITSKGVYKKNQKDGWWYNYYLDGKEVVLYKYKKGEIISDRYEYRAEYPLHKYNRKQLSAMARKKIISLKRSE